MYDGVLTLAVPRGVEITDFADDIALTVSAVSISHKVYQKASIMAGTIQVESTRSLKYLGVVIDDRLKFKSYLEKACKKATKAVNALAAFTPNIGGPNSSI